MTANLKTDSNQTGLAIALEASQNVLPGSPVWYSLEPNTYKNLGGQYKLVARQPINSSRQIRKGVIVDLDAVAGFQFDLTQVSLDQILPGIMFAPYRGKSDLPIPTTVTNTFEPASGGAVYKTGDLVFGKNFTNAANNAKFLLAANGSGTSIAATGVVAETGSAGTISRVGFRFTSGDATIAVSGQIVTLGTTTKDLTTLGLNVGEWIFVGGDASGTSFATDPFSNGFGRIATIAANAVTFDKWEQIAGVAGDTGSGKTIEIYFGRVIKNETGASGLITHYTYQIERTLPQADTSDSFVQAEYVTGASLNELDFTFNSGDKLTCDLDIMGSGYQQEPGSSGPKSGSRPALTLHDAYNSTSDVRRAVVSICGQESALFGYFTQGSIAIKNNITQNKAVGVLGSFAQTAGFFQVSGAVTAYFVAVAATATIKNNSNVTLDYILAKNNAGFAIDVPLVALGGGLLDVKLNQAITLPLTADAATAASLNASTDYTLLISVYDYLPNLAMPSAI